MKDNSNHNPDTADPGQRRVARDVKRRGIPVYLLVGETQVERELMCDLEEAGFAAQAFSLMQDFKQACQVVQPAAVVIDLARRPLGIRSNG